MTTREREKVHLGGGTKQVYTCGGCKEVSGTLWRLLQPIAPLHHLATNACRLDFSSHTLPCVPSIVRHCAAVAFSGTQGFS